MIGRNNLQNLNLSGVLSATPQAADGYRQAKRAAVWAVSGAKTLGLGGVWGVHGEGPPFGLKEVLANRSQTSTEDIVSLCKEYFGDLLNPSYMPSIKTTESEDSEIDSSITQADITEVVQKLLSGRAPGMDDICPEYLKYLYVVGLSWLT